MDVLWIAPLVGLVAALAALVICADRVRRSASLLASDRPALLALREDLGALHGDLVTLRARVDACRAASGHPSDDR